MTRAYEESYLGCTRRALANMLDRAVNRCGMELRNYYDLFLISSVAERFGDGDCSVVAGRSGAELLEVVLEECGAQRSEEQESGTTAPDERNREYWTGWALAYYQWQSGLSFKQIDRTVPIEEIREMYFPYHEMDILSFCEEMEHRIAARRDTETRLSFYRKKLGLSQRQLAEAAGIPVRTIQQYEQRQKDINRAGGAYILQLSKVLHCRQQDLMEN